MLRRTNFDPGGFSEYVRLPSVNVERGTFLLPESVSYENATFIEPLACVLRGQRIASVKEGDTILVMGSGLAGILHAHMAKMAGAALVIATDIVDYRMKQAMRFGADACIDAGGDVPRYTAEINNGMLADVVIVCTGAPKAIEESLRSVRRGGTVLFFAATDKGVTVPLAVNDTFWRTEITLTSSYAASPEEHRQALKLIESGKVKVQDMITHRLGLGETGKGFQLVASAKDSLKVIIEPER
jgi:L-iditol 2-dehydrogenase